jgi:hypothetical protein
MSLPAPREIGRALLLGVPAGAALFGAAVAFLGGASLPLVAAFWSAGALLAGGQAWAAERWRRRAARRTVVQPLAALPPVDPEEERRARRLAQERLVLHFYGPDRLGIPNLPPPPREEIPATAEQTEPGATTPAGGGHVGNELPAGAATASTASRPPLASAARPEAAVDAPAPASTPRKRGAGRRKATSADPAPEANVPPREPAPRKRRATNTRRPVATATDSPAFPEGAPVVVRAPGQPGSEVRTETAPEPAEPEGEMRAGAAASGPGEMAVIEGGQA